MITGKCCTSLKSLRVTLLSCVDMRFLVTSKTENPLIDCRHDVIFLQTVKVGKEASCVKIGIRYGRYTLWKVYAVGGIRCGRYQRYVI
jgi:hypothetical protein